ncbi:MAG: hypothetical protein IK130_10800 [Oscillospiraceae bacterium]|nr:hypothetical protein [Oscillospiraceae bacterium]
MQLKKSILFWSLILAAAYLALIAVLGLAGLRLRVWLRESLTVLIAAGAAAGILQILLRIPEKKARLATAAVWAAAAVVCTLAGTVIFAFYHPEESTEMYQGRICVAEEVLMHKVVRRYYEAHGLFVRGAELLYEWHENE